MRSGHFTKHSSCLRWHSLADEPSLARITSVICDTSSSIFGSSRISISLLSIASIRLVLNYATRGASLQSVEQFIRYFEIAQPVDDVYIRFVCTVIVAATGNQQIMSGSDLRVGQAFVLGVPAIDRFYAIQPARGQLFNQNARRCVRRLLQLIWMSKNCDSAGNVYQLKQPSYEAASILIE